MNKMEVKLKITAIGNTKKELQDRLITLNDKKPFVDVGRASTNPLKAIVPSEDNAMINSPIISRQHARFAMRTIPTKGVTLEDTASTHGTYIGGRKLEKFAPYHLVSGEDVTFGCKVTNGDQNHTPKTFRVSYDINDSKLAPSKPSMVYSNAFRAPEPEELSDSEDSRAASVEVLEGNPRTYSVPSTDDEDSYGSDYMGEDDVVSVGEKDQDTSAATTPESKTIKSAPERKNSDIEKLLNKDVQVGSSQQNPIKLDQGPSKVSYSILDSESESGDSVEYEPKEAEPKAPKAPSPPVRPQHPLSAILNEQPDHDAQASNAKMVPETQNLEMIAEAAKSIIGEASDSESESDDSMDEEEANTFNKKVFGDVDKVSSHPIPLAPPFHRAPSPSDAALAKQGTVLKRSYHAAYFTPRPAFDPLDYSVSPYHMTSSCEPPYQRKSGLYPDYWSSHCSFSDTRRSNPIDSQKGKEPARSSGDLIDDGFFSVDDSFYNHSGSFGDTWDASTSLVSNCGSTKASDAATTTTRDKLNWRDRCDGTGPYSSRLNISNLINDSQKNTNATSEVPRSSLKRKADDISLGDEEALPSESTEKPSTIGLSQASPTKIQAPVSNRQAVSLPGLTTTGSVVHTPLPPRSLSPVGAFYPATSPTFSPSSPSYSPMLATMDDVDLEPPASESYQGSFEMNNMIDEHSHQNETHAFTDIEHPKEVPVKEPTVVTIPSPKEDVEEERPRKKAQTASSKVGGIAKFMAGAACGAVGILAAIVAMAPDDVKAEAMREMGGL